MNWSDLQVLLAFRCEGTLQKAATKLGMDISTVSRRIRSLEAALEAKVVENVGGRLVLTACGERAARAAEAMAIESDNLQREVRGEESVLSGTLRVALLDLFVLFHADLLRAFATRYPHVTLEFVSGTSHRHSLTRREADVAIRATKQPDETLVGMRALQSEYAVYAHRAIAETRPASWDALPWIGWDPASKARLIDAWMAKHVPNERVRFRVDSPAVQFLMAAAGGGACILPVIYAEQCHNLVRLSDELAGFDTEVWLLTHRDLRHNGRVRAFLQHFYQGLEPLRSGQACDRRETFNCDRPCRDE